MLASGSETQLAFDKFAAFVDWRRKTRVDLILDNEEINEEKIKAALPNTWFFMDRDGRPCWYFQLENFCPNRITTQQMQMFFVRELEHTWREKLLAT